MANGEQVQEGAQQAQGGELSGAVKSIVEQISALKQALGQSQSVPKEAVAMVDQALQGMSGFLEVMSGGQGPSKVVSAAGSDANAGGNRNAVPEQL